MYWMTNRDKSTTFWVVFREHNAIDCHICWSDRCLPSESSPVNEPFGRLELWIQHRKARHWPSLLYDSRSPWVWQWNDSEESSVGSKTRLLTHLLCQPINRYSLPPKALTSSKVFGIWLEALMHRFVWSVLPMPSSLSVRRYSVLTVGHKHNSFRVSERHYMSSMGVSFASTESMNE